MRPQPFPPKQPVGARRPKSSGGTCGEKRGRPARVIPRPRMPGPRGGGAGPGAEKSGEAAEANLPAAFEVAYSVALARRAEARAWETVRRLAPPDAQAGHDPEVHGAGE